MSFLLFLIACFIGMCVLYRPVADQGASCSDDDDDDGLRNFLSPAFPGSFDDDSVKVDHYTGLNLFPGDTDDSA